MCDKSLLLESDQVLIEGRRRRSQVYSRGGKEGKEEKVLVVDEQMRGRGRDSFTLQAIVTFFEGGKRLTLYFLRHQSLQFLCHQIPNSVTADHP